MTGWWCKYVNVKNKTILSVLLIGRADWVSWCKYVNVKNETILSVFLIGL